MSFVSVLQTVLQKKGGGITPSVSDIIILFSDDTAANNVGIIFNDVLQGVGSINNMVKRHKLVYTAMGDDDAGTPVDHTGEWTSESPVASQWEVACLAITTGPAWDTEPAAVGVYTALSVEDLLWNINRVGGKGRATGTTRTVGDFRLREVADVANFTDFEVDITNTQT